MSEPIEMGTQNFDPKLQSLWAGLLIEELIRQDVGLFVLASGSRSTPLALAVAENPRANHLLHFDERGGAFVAIGFARATGTPAVWITTSGTAVANGLPAVIEADADGVPLIMLTADRPPELRETGANQTIKQPDILGSYVRWQFDVPVADPSIDPAFILTTVGQAVHRSRSPRGPVHLNCMFREPFANRDYEKPTAPDVLKGWEESNRPYTRFPESTAWVSDAETSHLASRLDSIEQGLVILGKSDDPKLAHAALSLADSLGWPLLSDIASGSRFRNATNTANYDLLLCSKAFRERFQPEAVVHLGGKIASKRLLQFIADSKPPSYIVVRPDSVRYDPAHIVTDRIQADVVGFCQAISAELVPPSRSTSWMQSWKQASAAVEQVIEGALNIETLTEPGIARAISQATPDGRGLVVASSMPIRDMNAFAASLGQRVCVAANRGASGIDGTVATAAGFARGLNQPATLFIGDLALLHDLNSLALLREGPPITVAVVNNDGGGIFGFLPIAERKDVFEIYFGTPHGLSFDNAAEMFGLTYAQPTTMAEFSAAYESAVAGTRSSIIEVRTDRDKNVTFHRELESATIRAVEKQLEP